MISWFLFGVAQVVYIQCNVNNHWGWKYDQQTRQITICENFAQGDYVAKHEFWHWLRFERMSWYEKNKFKRITEKETDCVTAYACTSLEENFAENVRAVMMKGKVDTDKKKFIRWLLRKYEVYY